MGQAINDLIPNTADTSENPLLDLFLEAAALHAFRQHADHTATLLNTMASL
jgi:hypothetical protein